MTEKDCKSMSLLKLAEERFKKKLEQQKQKKSEADSIPYLPKDCVSNILIRLPIESLQRSRFVCKPWYNVIKSPKFVLDNLIRAEKVMIFLTPVNRFMGRGYYQDSGFRENPKTFSVESRVFELKSVHGIHDIYRPITNSLLKYAIKYMVLANETSVIGDFNATCFGGIRTSWDGLIVLDNKLKNGELVIMNPVTRELDLLPLGTIYPPHDESFGLVSNGPKGHYKLGHYKLVYLFRDESQFIGCEVLNIGETSWNVIDGPSFGLIKWFGYDPVFVLGALHWVPEIDHSEHILSMTINDEKFHKIALPKTCRFNDRIMEVSGRLCFVTHEEMNEISIWILESLSGSWAKKYTITVGCIRDLIPLYFSSSKWEIYFLDKDFSVFVYDFEGEQMRKVAMKKGDFPGVRLVHVNSLVSWRINENDRDDIDP